MFLLLLDYLQGVLYTGQAEKPDDFEVTIK
jgi:hypothetical protein